MTFSFNAFYTVDLVTGDRKGMQPVKTACSNQRDSFFVGRSVWCKLKSR